MTSWRSLLPSQQFAALASAPSADIPLERSTQCARSVEGAVVGVTFELTYGSLHGNNLVARFRATVPIVEG